MRVFAERLRALREEKGLSCLALSKILEVSDSMIFYWETGKSDIKSDTVVKIAKFFGVTTDYLLGLSDC